MLDDGLDEVFDDDVEPIEPELIAGELPEEEESADDL
jgi:hypothetical protein